MDTINSLLVAIEDFYRDNGERPTRIKLRADMFEKIKNEFFGTSHVAAQPEKKSPQSINGIPIEVTHQQPEWVFICE